MYAIFTQGVKVRCRYSIAKGGGHLLITYTTQQWDGHRHAYVADTVATLRVDADDTVCVEGNPTYVDLNLSVMDLDRGRPVTFQEDREAWARNLWTAYRTPDLTVDVTETVVHADTEHRPVPEEVAFAARTVNQI